MSRGEGAKYRGEVVKKKIGTCQLFYSSNYQVKESEIPKT